MNDIVTFVVHNAKLWPLSFTMSFIMFITLNCELLSFIIA